MALFIGKDTHSDINSGQMGNNLLGLVRDDCTRAVVRAHTHKTHIIHQAHVLTSSLHLWHTPRTERYDLFFSWHNYNSSHLNRMLIRDHLSSSISFIKMEHTSNWFSGYFSIILLINDDEINVLFLKHPKCRNRTFIVFILS